MRKVIDCFIFYNELDMLDFRLKELNDCVDKFVLVESTHTFTGKIKKIFFNENKERYKDYLHKIEHIIVDDCPNTDNPWDNEIYQRMCIKKGIENLKPQDHDIIIISDVDEVPSSHAIELIKKYDKTTPFTMMIMDMYYFNITTKDRNPWVEGTRLLPYGMFRDEFETDSQRVRFTFSDMFRLNNPKMKTRSGVRIIKNGGWHLSYFGDEQFIQNKIMNFSHQEHNKPHITDLNKIKKCIEERKDIFQRRGIEFIHVPIETNGFLPNSIDLLNK